MNTTTAKKGKLMSSRSVVEQAIDRTKSNKQLSWNELLTKTNEPDAKYPIQNCRDEQPARDPSKVE